MVYQVPYAKFRIDPSTAFPQGRIAARPILALTLESGGQRFSCIGIVDSGADVCTFPLSFAGQLGIDLSKAGTEPCRGLGSSGVPGYFADITRDSHGVCKLDARVGFSAGVDAWGIGLLGQIDFFDRVGVTFDHAAGVFYLDVP